ncbi:MAG: NAD(P)/FAD-dependent oxidoreductase [Steroidobacteraceae bacterium]
MSQSSAAKLKSDDAPFHPGAVTEALRNATDDEIRSAIKVAHLPTLRGLLYFLTGDEGVANVELSKGPGFLTANGVYIKRPQDVAMLHEKAFDVLKAYRSGEATPPDPATVSKEKLLRVVSFMVGMEVPESEYGYWREEFAFDPWARELKWPSKPAAKVRDFKVIVVGAGTGGVNAAIQLKRAGFSFKVFERNGGVGGTWYDNSYPGARVDLASRIYSHLFGVGYPWQHTFATAAENKSYVDWCVDTFGIRQNIQFNTEVIAMHWNEQASEWMVRVRNKDGTVEVHRANGIISAGGLFDRPTFGNFKGTESFRGIKMHTARYNPRTDLSGCRVAIIGTGASGAQLLPDLAPTVKSVTVFQRTPPWVLPFPGYRDEFSQAEKWLNANVPYYVNFSRVAIHWLAGDHDQWYAFTVDPDWKDEHTLNKDTYDLRQRCIAHIKERLAGRPDLVAKCVPDYPPLTKRFVLDNGWYDALKRDNVQLITEPIDHIEEDGVVTSSGQKFEFDAIIFATGYLPNAFLQPMDIRGRGGITPQDVWKKDGGRAYWGVTVPGLPNFFMVYGPGTNGKISGPVPWGEMQTRYALTCFKMLIETNRKFLDVRKSAYEEFNGRLDEELAQTIWLDKRQQSYYQNEFGRSATNSPWKVLQLWTAWREPDLDHYELG